MSNWSASRGVLLRELEAQTTMEWAAPSLDMRISPDSVQELTANFRAFPGALEQAIVQAANKTRLEIRKFITKGLTDIVTLTPAYVSRAVSGYKARCEDGGAKAEVRVASLRSPLSRYAVKPERAPALRGVPVAARRRTSYRLRQGGKLYGDSPRNHSGATGALFVQNMQSGHMGVFYRQGKSIIEQYAPSVQYHLYADNFMDRIMEECSSKFLENFKQAARGLRGVQA